MKILLKPEFSKRVFIAGFALFSMFFGAGNLIFPILIGTQTLGSYGYSIVGLLLTGVFVPFIGLFSMILFNGNRKHFFEALGPVPTFLVLFSLLLLMGPIGAAPRCVIVSFSSFKMLFPDLSQPLFNAGYCILVAALVWNRGRIVNIVGAVLTPLLFGSILILFFLGLFNGALPINTHFTNMASFMKGLTEGYQTMDLLAAFFFSSTTVHYMYANLPEHCTRRTIAKLSLSAGIIGASMLAFVYVGFVLLGAKHSEMLQNLSPDKFLFAIAAKDIGRFAVPLVCTMFSLACLTTVVALVSLFADFLNDDLSHKKLGEKSATIITLIITYTVSLVDFTTICTWLGSVISVIYPALIAFAVANIINKVSKIQKLPAVAFYLTLVSALFFRFL